MNPIVSLIVSMIARHFFTVAGTATAATGAATGSDVEAIAGAVVALINVCVQAYMKHRALKENSIPVEERVITPK